MTRNAASFKEALAALNAKALPSKRQLCGLSSLEGDSLTEVQSVWSHLDSQRRITLVEKLREMAEDDVELDFSALFLYSLQDVEEQVRLSSVDGLWEYENPSLIDKLVLLLSSDPSILVRAASATALGRFLELGELEKITRRRRDQVYSALMGALMTMEPGSLEYLHALEALACVSNDEIEGLIHAAYASDIPALRISAVTAMGRSANRQFSDLVRRELFSVLPAMRAEAARASGELEVAEAVTDLGKLIDDPEQEVAIAAVTALGQVGGEEARRLLEQAAQSDDEEIAGAAEEALAEDEFLHGDIKFTTTWLDELSHDETGD